MSGRLERAADRVPGPTHVPSDIRRRLVGRLRGYLVWLVDGRRLRDDVDVDFTCGGNPARYQYVPESEIWIDEALSVADRRATALHEIVETEYMMRGLAYGDAHDIASEVERFFRHTHRA